MSETSGEIIKAEAAAGEFRRVGIQELLDAPQSGKREHFLRFRPDGRLPVITPPKKEPEISSAELQARRLEQLEREIYQRAFAAAESAGLKAGEERAERELQALIPQFEGVLANLEQLHVRVLAASERFLVETALVLTRELLAAELTVNPEIVAARVKRILSRASGRRAIVIRVSPGNAMVLGRVKGFANLRIEADEQLSPGAVHLESDFGGLEDNLELQLKEVELAMREHLQERLEAIGVAEIAEQARNAAEVVAARPPHPLAPDPGSEPVRVARVARPLVSAEPRKGSAGVQEGDRESAPPAAQPDAAPQALAEPDLAQPDLARQEPEPPEFSGQTFADQGLMELDLEELDLEALESNGVEPDGLEWAEDEDERIREGS